jgi:sulfur-oxidizing protein SoxY
MGVIRFRVSMADMPFGRMALAAAILTTGLLSAATARAEESEASRAARWHDVADAIFKDRPVLDGSAILQLDAPPRALDASLVPVSVTVAQTAAPKALYLIIDDNPAPVAAIVHFGPLADPHSLKLRVRVDQYTLMHAVAELQDGRLVGVSRFIKAAGGCSAPGGGNAADEMARLGRMKLMVRNVGGPDRPEIAELLISHPNFNGMQMNPVTRLYTPARYVQTVRITEGAQSVLTLDGDISLSEDPAITFGFKPGPGAKLDVEVDDSAHAVFRQSFSSGSHAS